MRTLTNFGVLYRHYVYTLSVRAWQDTVQIYVTEVYTIAPVCPQTLSLTVHASACMCTSETPTFSPTLNQSLRSFIHFRISGAVGLSVLPPGWQTNFHKITRTSLFTLVGGTTLICFPLVCPLPPMRF